MLRCRDAGFSALLPRPVFAEMARAARCFLLRRARMQFLLRRRFSSALARDSNLATGFFVALMAAFRCMRSTIASPLAVLFHPARHGALAAVDKGNYLNPALRKICCSVFTPKFKQWGLCRLCNVYSLAEAYVCPCRCAPVCAGLRRLAQAVECGRGCV